MPRETSLGGRCSPRASLACRCFPRLEDLRNVRPGRSFVDRFLHTPMTYPGNYGFVPHTLSDDGDPIDVLICNTRPLVPGCVINVRPIGVLVMEDNSRAGRKDHCRSLAASDQALPSVQQLRRPARDHAAADRALLRALQGSRSPAMGQDRRTGRMLTPCPPDDRRGDRARQDQGLTGDLFW